MYSIGSQPPEQSHFIMRKICIFASQNVLLTITVSCIDNTSGITPKSNKSWVNLFSQWRSLVRYEQTLSSDGTNSRNLNRLVIISISKTTQDTTERYQELCIGDSRPTMLPHSDPFQI